MDPVVTPILIKTLDWLFGEGSKILQARRERREANHEADKVSPEPSAPAPRAPSTPDIIHSKENALKSPIIPSLWANSAPNIMHLLSLLEIHTRNYYLAKEQYAKWGSALVPPIITHNLTEAEDQIAATARELQIALNAVYGKKINIPELEQV